MLRKFKKSSLFICVLILLSRSNVCSACGDVGELPAPPSSPPTVKRASAAPIAYFCRSYIKKSDSEWPLYICSNL